MKDAKHVSIKVEVATFIVKVTKVTDLSLDLRIGYQSVVNQ